MISLTPRTNGKVERFNGTLAREWAYVRNYICEAERLAALADFLNYYKHERPHSALNGQAPITRTRGSNFRIVVEQAPQDDDRQPTQLALEFEAPTY